MQIVACRANLEDNIFHKGDDMTKNEEMAPFTIRLPKILTDAMKARAKKERRTVAFVAREVLMKHFGIVEIEE